MKMRPPAALRITGTVSRLSHAAALVLAVQLLTTCSETPVSPTRRGQGVLRLAPVFPAGSRAAGLALDNVRLVVVRPPNTTLLDQGYPFPASQTELTISEQLTLQSESEELEVTLTCLSGQVVLFRGSQLMVVRQGPAIGPGVRVPVEWVGPGNEITTISLAPRDTVLTVDATLAFRVAASDAEGQAVAAFYVTWESSDPDQHPDGAGVLHAGGTRSVFRVTATTPSGARDSTTVTVVPAPARLVATSGDNQSAPVGSRLAQELEVEVRGPDDLPIPGATVTFGPPSGGSVDVTTAVTGPAGRTRTGATLGPGAGPQSFTASVPGAGTVTFNASATQVPAASFTSASQSVSEGGGSASITLQLSSPAIQPVSIPFSLSGTATDPADFTTSASPLTIAAGGTTATITVNVVADGVAEPDETVIATLDAPTNATLGPSTVHTLTISGTAPTVSFTAAAQTVGEAAGTATITAQLSSPSAVPVTVPFTLSGTATRAVDYTATASPLTITPGNTSATVTLTLVADAIAEPDETVIATLEAPTNAALGAIAVHTVTIPGQVPTVSFTQASQSVPEGVVATITADLSTASTQAVTVPFTLAGTAADQADYAASTSPLVIPAGSTSATITVTTVADGVAESDETVIATLGTPTNAVLGTTTVHILTITGQVPTVSFTAATQSANEGAVATITIDLSSTATQPVTVPFTLTGTAATPADFTATASPLVIAAGSTSATMTVTLAADGVAEADETVIATLGTPTNATLGALTVHTLIIAGGDPTVSFTAVSQTADEGEVVIITAQLSSASTQVVTLPFALSGTATAGADYTATASPLTIAAGSTAATITVTVAADGVAEPDETIIATLGAPTNALLGAIASHTITIAGQVPTVSFAAATQSAGEGAGTASIVVQLSSPSTQAVTIPYTVSGSASSPADYTIPASPLVIAAGNSSGTIPVSVVADGVAEPDETVAVTLGAPTNAALGAITLHTLTIIGQLPTVSFTTAGQSVSEGGAVTITALLSTTSTQTVTIPFSLTGTAGNTVDYTATASPLTIAAGGTTATITLTTVSDGIDEPDETAIVTLGAPTNATLGAQTIHAVTILGQTPTVSFTAATQTVSEGVVATITAQLSSPSTQQVTVPFTTAGTANNPADYTITTGPLVITPGNTTATIDVTVAADGVAEPGETVIVTLGTPTNASLGAITVHTLTIAGQQPTVTFTAANQSVNEGTVATITAQLSGPSTLAVSVPFTTSGTAGNPADYTITASPVVIPAGSTTGTISVTVAADGVAEPNETVVVTMGVPTNAVQGAIIAHTVTIAAQLPTVSFTQAAQTVSEGAAATVTAQLSGPSAVPVTIPFNLTGTATNTADYTATASPLTIAAGSTTATITISVVADAVAEPNETAVVTMGPPTNATLGTTTVHTLTIAAQVPTVSFTAATQIVSEGTVATITAQLSSPSTQMVTVPFSATGTATNPADYTITANPLVIAPGSTSGTISVTTVIDGVAEPNETVVVTMGAPTNATAGAITVHTVTIAAQLPTVSFTAASQSVSEGVGTATITARLSTPSTLAVSVPYTVSGTATSPADYTIPAGPLVIAAGSTTGTISVTVVADSVAEPNETVIVTMGPPTNATAVAPTAHTLTIAAQVPIVSFTVASNSVSENVGTATITLRLSLPSTQDVSVPYTLGGSATFQTDYSVNDPSPIVISAGKTSVALNVPVVNDATSELNETVIVTLGNPTGAMLGTPSVHTLTILDNDRALTVAFSGRGSGTVATPAGFSPVINCATSGTPGQCAATYPNGTQVSLTATPTPTSEGIFRFEGWTGTGTGFTCTTSTTCVVLMDQNRQVTARFSTWGTITFVPPSAAFAMQVRGAPPAPTIVKVTNTGERPLPLNGTIPITYSPQVTPWLDAKIDRLTVDTLTPANLTLTVLAAASGFAAGTYQATVIILDAGNQRSWGLTVTLTITSGHPPVLSNISSVQVGAINTCDIFGGPLGTGFRVDYDYSDAGGDVRSGATIQVSYVFSNGFPGSFDGTPFTFIGGDGFTGTMRTDTCFLFGQGSFVDVTITVRDVAGFVSQPITVRILRPAGANSAGDPQPLGVGSATRAAGIESR